MLLFLTFLVNTVLMVFKMIDLKNININIIIMHTPLYYYEYIKKACWSFSILCGPRLTNFMKEEYDIESLKFYFYDNIM